MPRASGANAAEPEVADPDTTASAGFGAAVSAGTLLGGRVAYVQPLRGHRSGLEPVLIAALVPARAGQRVIEGGTGAGAGLLCLTARVPGLGGIGVELDPSLASLARCNLAANGMGGITVRQADVTNRGTLEAGEYAHAFANPPWHRGTVSADAHRSLARQSRPGLLVEWAAALARAVRHRGTVTLALPASALAEAVSALREAGCGGVTVLPLWPRAGVAARLMLVQARRGSQAGSTIRPGLVLHDADGRFTRRAEDVLRGSADLLRDF